ncbi:MAG: HEAT repeat domain-containing protein [Terriglobia bacterium]
MSQAEKTPSATAPEGAARSRPPILLLVFIFLAVLIPFLFWRGTWFGLPLSEADTAKYLSSTERPRKTQHALAQVGEQILRGDPGVKQWYPQVRALAADERAEIRLTVAWVMGQDNRSEEFHAGLLELVEDSIPLVRRNAALALVRFGDARGLPVLRAMLRPAAVLAPEAGRLATRLQVGDKVQPGTLLARIRTQENEEVEIRSLLPGEVQKWLAAEGAAVSAHDAVVLLSPAEEQVWEALRALYVIGQPEDLPDIEAFARGVSEMPERIRQQATLTAEAIRRRAGTQETPPAQDGTG